MRIAIVLCSLMLLTTISALSQDFSGTWHGFQTSRDKGKVNEYRVTLDLSIKNDNDITGTMQLKSPQKGVITSSISGRFERKDNLIYLKENEILTEGITAEDAKLCSYIIKVSKNSLKGTGRSRSKGYDHLKLSLKRRSDY